MASQEELRIDISADSKQFVKEMGKVQSRLRKTEGGTRRQSQAFTQLAYAMDDAQYGFRGVQNNLQQIAVTAGLAGPAILGITAALVLLNKYFEKPENSEKFFNAFRTSAARAKAAVDSLNKSLRETQGIQLTKDQQDIISYQNDENKAKRELIEVNKQLAKGDEVRQHIGRGQYVVVSGISKLERQRLEIEKERLQNALFDAKAFKEGAIEKVRLLDEQKRKEAELLKQKMKDKAFEDSRSKGFKFKTGGLGFFGTGLNFDPKVLKTARQEFASFGLGLSQTFESLGQKTGAFAEGFSNSFITIKERAKLATKDIKKDLESLNAQLNTMAAGGIANFAQALGEGLVEPKDLGKKLLGGIGGLMVAFGTALIAWGLGWKAFQEAPANPVVAVVAGAALVVAGAAISSIAAKASGSGSGGGTSGAGIASSRVSPSSIQGFGSGLSLTSTVRGQDLRFVLQGANDSYSGRN